MIVEEVCAVPFVVFYLPILQDTSHFIMGRPEKFNCYKKSGNF
jgi:hypothetical protein